MPRLKVLSEMAHMEPDAQATDGDVAVIVEAHTDMIAHQSPALALQAGIEQSWDARNSRDAVQVARIPLGWTLIGMSIVCAAFWYTLLQLIF